MKTNSHVEECVNLVDLISNLLAKHNHPRPSDWIRHLHPDAVTTTDQNIQRFLINRAWRSIIGAVTTENTMDVRYCLVDQGEISDWVRLFETGVIPCILMNNLPPPMN